MIKSDMKKWYKKLILKYRYGRKIRDEKKLDKKDRKRRIEKKDTKKER